MKKRITIFSVLLLVLVYSCRKSLMPKMDEGSAAMGKFNVNAARDHIKLLVKGEVAYDGKMAIKTMSSTGTLSFNGTSQKTIKTGQKIFYPFWDRAITSNFKGKVDYVEVPIAISKRQIRLYQFAKDNIKQKPDASVAKAAFQRLVVYKDSRGNVGQRLVTYIPDKQYLMEHGYEASTNSLSKLNRDFFGYIEYKNWSGDIVSVLRIENGKVVRKYSINKGSKEQLQALNTQRAAATKEKVMSSGDTKTSSLEEVCEYVWVPIMETVCEVNDDGNPNDENLNEIECTLQEVGEYMDLVCTWVDVPDPEPCPWGDCDEEPCTDCEEPESPPVDCAGVLFGTAYMSDDCGCIGGTTGITECSDDPCKEAKEMDYKKQMQSAAYSSLASQPSSAEYGMEERLTSIPGNDYNPPNIRTTGTNNFAPVFTWNASEGYTIGFAHKHTNGTGPSPADIMTPFEFSYRPVLATNQTWQNYYRSNMSVTTISGSNTYMMTIADWAAVKNIYDNNTASQLTVNYQQHATDYFNNNSGATVAAASEYALMQIFGSSINFYKQNPTTGKFEAYKLDASGNIQKINCP